MMSIISLSVIAILIESLIEPVSNTKYFKLIKASIPTPMILSLILGITMTVTLDVDIIRDIFGSNVFFGKVLSGIIASRGSNFVNDIISKIRESRV